MQRHISLALAIVCVAAMPAWGQLEEVVVTGSRISGDDYSGIPAVVLQRRADFLVQSIRLTNDTRAENARIKELQQTIRDMVSDAAKKPGIALSYGDEFLIPISATATEVVLIAGDKRPDTSSTSIYVKMALGEKDDVPAAIASLKAFIKKARVSGRTEIEPEGDVGLSLRDSREIPVRHHQQDHRGCEEAQGGGRGQVSDRAFGPFQSGVLAALRCIGTDAVHSLSNTARGMRIATMDPR